MNDTLFQEKVLSRRPPSTARGRHAALQDRRKIPGESGFRRLRAKELFKQLRHGETGALALLTLLSPARKGPADYVNGQWGEQQDAFSSDV